MVEVPNISESVVKLEVMRNQACYNFRSTLKHSFEFNVLIIKIPAAMLEKQIICLGLIVVNIYLTLTLCQEQD